MKTLTTTLSAVAVMCSTFGTALAQDKAAGHDMAAMASGQIKLPEICMAAGEQPPGEMAMGMHPQMDEAHTALMDGMDEMNRQMMTGMMAEDIDVAFVCGMIPHHQSAITMAQAALKYGDDPWAKELAQKVIDAQQQEISDMLTWLDKRAAAEMAK